jgi:hypothetical protein
MIAEPVALDSALEILQMAAHCSPPDAPRDAIFERAIRATLQAAREAATEPNAEAEITHSANVLARLHELRAQAEDA